MVKLRKLVTDGLFAIVGHIDFYANRKEKYTYIKYDKKTTEEMDNLLKEIIKRTRQPLTEEVVRKGLQDILADVLRSDQQNKYNLINQKVGSLLNKLKVKKYAFIFRIYNLKTSKIRKFGEIQIFPDYQTLADEIKKRTKKSINKNIHSRFFQSTGKIEVPYSFVIMEVEAGDTGMAELKTLTKIEIHLKALSLLSGKYNFLIGREVIPMAKRMMYIGPKDNDLHLKGKLENKDLFTHPFDLDYYYKSQRTKKLLRRLDEIFRNDENKRRKIDDKITVSINWYGEGLKEISNEYKIIKLVIALESLLLEGEGCKKKSLAERVSYLCIKRKRVFVHNMVNRAYDYRNSLVHEGKLKECIPEYFSNNLAELVRQLIISLVTKDKFSSIEDIIKYTNKKMGLE